MWSRFDLKSRARQQMHLIYWPLVLVSLIFAVASLQMATPVLQVSLNRLSDSLNNTYYYMTPYFLQRFLRMFAVALGSASLLGLVLRVFLLAPLSVGCQRYFLTSLEREDSYRSLLHNFGPYYWNTVDVMFFRSLYIFLWSLLLLIPGVIKSYEYRLVPYLLAEHPDMPRRDALRISQELMQGEKWNAFVLDLSFLGWDLLGLITLGLVSLFYVGPYQNLTYAAFYTAVCEQPQSSQNGVPVHSERSAVNEAETIFLTTYYYENPYSVLYSLDVEQTHYHFQPDAMEYVRGLLARLYQTDALEESLRCYFASNSVEIFVGMLQANHVPYQEMQY